MGVPQNGNFNIRTLIIFNWYRIWWSTTGFWGFASVRQRWSTHLNTALKNVFGDGDPRYFMIKWLFHGYFIVFLDDFHHIFTVPRPTRVAPFWAQAFEDPNTLKAIAHPCGFHLHQVLPCAKTWTCDHWKDDYDVTISHNLGWILDAWDGHWMNFGWTWDVWRFPKRFKRI